MTTIESRLELNFALDGSVGTVPELLERMDHVSSSDYSVKGDDWAKIHALVAALDFRLLTPSGHRYSSDIDILCLRLSCSRLTGSAGQAYLNAVLEFVRSLHVTTEPRYAFGLHSRRAARIGQDHLPEFIPSPISDEGLAENRVDHPTWLMLFPPAMVDTYGHEWLLNLPADRVDELDDGSIVVVVTEAFLDCDSDVEIAQTMDEAMAPVEDAFASR
jgi:hypothetical protein